MARERTRRETRTQRRLRKLGSALVTWTCVLIIVGGAVYLAYNYLEDRHQSEQTARLRALYRSGIEESDVNVIRLEVEETLPAPTEVPTPEPTATPEPTPTPVPVLTVAPEDLIQELPTVEDERILPTFGDAEDLAGFDMPVAVDRISDNPMPTPTATPEPTAAPEPIVEPTATPETRPTRRPSATPAVELTPEERVTLLQPGFKKLYAVNPDVVGWVTAGKDVDFPIVWRDNMYYLNHDFEGLRNKNGTVFLDARNDIDMTDDVVVLYGHNMRSGAMFGNIDDYRDPACIIEQPFIMLQSAWQSQAMEYVVFSVFDASMNDKDPNFFRITNFRFETPEEKLAYIEDIRKHSIYEIPVDVRADDQLVLLVTCSYDNDDGRFLMYGRQTRDDETDASIRRKLAGIA